MTNGTVLIAEDSSDDFVLFKRALERARFANPIQRVEDGEKAIAYLAGDGSYGDRTLFPMPVLFILDLKMPRRSGLEVLEWMQRHPVYKKLPVIVLTSSSQHEDVNRAYSLGANSYLVKPGNFEDLIKLGKSMDDYWIGLNYPPEL